MLPVEFQAVVLAAGRGTRLPELTSEQPKCLLPLGAYPLLWYPLHTLQKHNFQDVIVIVLENQKNQIQQAIERTPLQLKIEYATIPSDSDWGTADSLRYIHDRIKSDLIIMSCDVITNASLYPLFNTFRQHNASVTALLFNSSNFDTVTNIPGPKSKNKLERDLIGIQTDTNRLLFLASTSDFEETFEINAHLLRKYQKFNIFSRLIDSHIYVVKKWVINLLKTKDSFSALKGELLPYIVKKQMARNSSSQIDAQSEAGANIKSDDIFQFFLHSSLDLEKKITNSSLFNDSRCKAPYDGDLIRCYAVRAPKDCIGLRVNTTINYYSANMKIFSLWENLISDKSASLVSSNATVKSTQMKNVAVAEQATLSEKTSFNSSVFGFSCFINSKVKITNSIIMNHVTIEEGCSIENSIICNRATVKKGSILVNCIVGPNYIVEEETKIKAAHLTNSDGFMEIE